MAIIERQNPTTPNLVESDLIYAVSSNNSSAPQFQFVAKIIDDDKNEVLIKQQPTPEGSLPAAKAVFNISQIARDYMGTDTPWKTAKVSTNSSCNEFDIIFYEETGSSVSSSVGLTNGVSGSSVFLLDGVVEMNSGDWNWASGSYYTASLASASTDVFSLQHALTTSPLTQSIRDGEYATLSVINGNFDNSSTHAQDIYYIQFNVYNESGTNIQNLSYVNTTANGGGPRALSTQTWDDSGVYNGQSTGERMIHIGVGPQNLEDAVATLNQNWYTYKVSGYGQGDDGLENSSAIYFEKWFTKQTAECDYDGTRFAWLNELGGWDYYTFPFANGKSDAIERKTYKNSFVDYSSATTYTVGYDKSRRGTDVYAMNFDETRTAESGYLLQEEADWLRTLVESKNVYIQEGTDFLPVVIETANYDYKTNPRTQKMYRLSLSYKLANNRRSK